MQENQHLVAVQAFAAQLYESGVRHVCISPGSRSTPLTMAFVRHGGFQIWSVLDERSAGFFAVGIGRVEKQPVVLVCTSGTATGNYLPSIMEAHNARLPLIVLTADRPPELYDTGANQTVIQTGLYGSMVKWHHQMPVPEDTKLILRHALATAARAVAVASDGPAGPVHINWPFREPLVIPSKPFVFSSETVPAPVRHWAAPGLELNNNGNGQWSEWVKWFSQQPRGLIVCGPLVGNDLVQPLVEFAEAYGWPVLADPLSQLRQGGHSHKNIVDGYDLLLRTQEFVSMAKPSLIVRFGAAMTSKAANQFLSHHRDVRQVVVDEGMLWQDATLTATDVIRLQPAEFCLRLAQGLREVRPRGEFGDARWLSWWQEVNGVVRNTVALEMAASTDPSHTRSKGRADAGDTATPIWQEGQLVEELVAVLPNPSNLFLGNSMPIRDFDSFLGVTDKRITLFANRGVSGIDGVVSSALGVAAATNDPTTLVIGDLSFYHDMTALLLAKRHEVSLLVVVINNNGGGIFSFLPQAEYPDTFHQFRTSHGLRYDALASLYGFHYETAENLAEFRQAVNTGIGLKGVSIVECLTDTDINVASHRRIYSAVNESVKKFCKDGEAIWEAWK